MSNETHASIQDCAAPYLELNKENIDWLMERYNRVNRWVVADMLRRTRYHFPDKPALVFGEQSLSYTQLEDQSNQVANALRAAGVKKYDRVAILAHNTLHHVLTWLGAAKIGAVYLAINYMLSGKEAAYCINHSQSKLFIVEDSLFPQVKDALADMPGVETLLWSNQGAGQPAAAGFTDFDSWFQSHSSEEPDAMLRIEDPVQLTYTSGTESLPKGVIISNQALISQYLGCIIDGGYDSSDICINALPLYHCAQRDVFLNPIFWVGGTNILLGPDIPLILQTIAERQATIFFAPPTLWIGMLRHPDFDNYDLSSLKKCYYGASIMPVEVLKKLLARLPQAKIYNYYGQTELAPYHTILKSEDAMTKLGSAGQGGLHMETRLEDDTGREIRATEEMGEICGRGPHALTMYFKDAEKTEDAMRGGWFHSGDLGVLDADNYLSVVDRKKDMVKSGGENVASREVEEAIYCNPAVKEVAVIGLSHPLWIEAVVAVIVLKEGTELSEEEIQVTCNDAGLAHFKTPKRVLFIEALPKSPTGKILKRELRDTFKELFAD